MTKAATEKFGNERKAGLEATEGQSGKDKKELIISGKKPQPRSPMTTAGIFD